MKIFATDYDGTLTAGAYEETRLAIRAWRRAGNLFGIVTGRDRAGARSCVRYVDGEVDFVLACNGAVGYDGALKRVLFSSTLPRDVIRPLSELAARYNCYNTVVERKFTRDVTAENTTVYEDALAHSLVAEDPCQVTTCIRAEHVDEAFAEIVERFGAVLEPQRNGLSVDCPPRGVNKAAGLARYAALTGCPLSDIFTAGDDKNDLPMLRAYTSFAMASGRREALDCATYTAPSVADAIRRSEELCAARKVIGNR